MLELESSIEVDFESRRLRDDLEHAQARVAALRRRLGEGVDRRRADAAALARLEAAKASVVALHRRIAQLKARQHELIEEERQRAEARRCAEARWRPRFADVQAGAAYMGLFAGVALYLSFDWAAALPVQGLFVGLTTAGSFLLLLRAQPRCPRRVQRTTGSPRQRLL